VPDLLGDHLPELLGAIASGIIIHDMVDGAVYANALAEQLMGVPFDQLRGHTTLSLHLHALRENGTALPAEEYPGYLAQQSGLPQRNIVLKLLQTDGSHRWLLVSAVPVRLPDGPVQHVVTTLTDITEQRRAEVSLRASRESFRLLFATNPQPMWVFDLQSLRFLEVNDAMVVKYGYSRDEILRMQTTEIRPREDVAKLLDILQVPHDDFVGVCAGEWRHRLKSGQIIDVEVTSQTLPFGDHKAMLVIANDITERKRAEAALRSSEERFRTFIEDMPVAALLMNPSGKIMMHNAAALDILRLTHEQLMGMTPLNADWAVVHEDGTPLPADQYPVAIAIASGAAVRNTVLQIYRTSCGDRIWVNGQAIPQYDDSGALARIICTFTDITARRQADAQIRRQLERLSSLHTIDATITSSLDLDLTLNVVLEQTIARLGVDAADVLLVDDLTQELVYSAGQGFRGSEISNTRLRPDEIVASQALLGRRTITVSDLRATNFARKKLLDEEAFVTYVAVPLISKGQSLGLFELFHRAPLNPDEDWMAFLGSLAGQAAIAITDALLFEDLQRSNTELRLAYDATIEGWSRALDLRDKETEGHSRRVMESTLALARAVGMIDDDLVHVRRGALLHDIGKLGVPDRVLLKPGPLTDEEWVLMRQHPVHAYEMLLPISYLRPALDIPYCHHEKWDGTGYPQGLIGDQIPLAARVFAVVDVWDALSSDRPYRKGWPAEKVREHLQSLAGTHFDPEIVRVFLNMHWPDRPKPASAT
jgi:PAS domain S-box-containing protein